jgi:USP8 dimerisation domain/Rhodanese-like domain
MSLKKLVEAAEKHKLEGDEEMSYCLYMKYMNLLTKIQKRSDYTKEKTLVGKMVGNNDTISKYLDTLEKLKNSLVERYDNKYPPQNVQPLAESTRIPDDFNESLSMTAIPKERSETVSCEELYKMMEEGHKLLIMDCRPESDYEQSKITYHYTINIPQHILTIGMTASKIQQQLPNESKVFWELRTSRTLIFMDWSSQRFNRNSPVWHLKEILLEWDEELEKKPEMLLLEGGYDFWKTHYPMKCNNPNFSPPNDLSGDAMGLDGIEYPNIDDIQMKDASLNKTQTPLVDRTMKLSAVKAYENNKTPLEILEEKDKLADKSLQNERELLNLETRIKDIVTDKENNEDSSIKEQSLMFQIWQLQSKQEDLSVEERTLKKQMEAIETKEQFKDTQERTKLMEVEEQLKQKENERKQIHEERERKRKEREEALRLARERKPPLNDHRTPPKTQRKDELILSPKALGNQVVAPSIPAFDRSAKPALNNTRYIFNEEDFSPVYARVVS